jgi:heat shock protein HslJ
MRQSHVLMPKLVFSALSFLFVTLFTSCLFSPAKSGDDFALGSRIWDGVEIDSAGETQSLDGWLRLHFDEEGEVQVQVGLRKGQAPFAVRSSGRMSLGFEDEPLTLGQADMVFNPATEALVAAFLAKVDRYRQDKGKLYLRTSAYPDIMITLKASDTSVVIGQKPKPEEPKKPKPDTIKVDTTLIDTLPPPHTPTQMELYAKLQTNVWSGRWLDTSRGFEIDLRNLFELHLNKDRRFTMRLPCGTASGSYSLSDDNHLVLTPVQQAKAACLTGAVRDADQAARAEAAITNMFRRPFFPTLSNGNLILRSHPALSSIRPMAIWLTAGPIATPVDTTLIDTIPPVIPIPDTTLILPADFPVYGGRQVPSARAGLFAQTVAAWSQWRSMAVTSYYFDFLETCFCLANRNGRVTVRDGKPAEFVSANPEIATQPALGDLPTVEALFAQIGLLLTRSYRADERISVTFGLAGEPTYLKADPIINTQQDDLMFSVSRFTPLKVVVTFPTLSLDQLIKANWILHSLQNNQTLVELSRMVSVKFAPDGSWTGTFGCNTYGGKVNQLADGRYAFSLDYQTFFECGDGAVTELLEALLKDPVIVQKVGERMVQIASVDGLLSALLGAEILPFPPSITVYKVDSGYVSDTVFVRQ